MEIQAINKLDKTAKTGLFICWLALTLIIGINLIELPKFNIIEMIAYIASQLNIFSNTKGGQPFDPTDFVM